MISLGATRKPKIIIIIKIVVILFFFTRHEQVGIRKHFQNPSDDDDTLTVEKFCLYLENKEKERKKCLSAMKNISLELLIL